MVTVTGHGENPTYNSFVQKKCIGNTHCLNYSPTRFPKPLSKTQYLLIHLTFQPKNGMFRLLRRPSGSDMRIPIAGDAANDTNSYDIFIVAHRDDIQLKFLTILISSWQRRGFWGHQCVQVNTRSCLFCICLIREPQKNKNKRLYIIYIHVDSIKLEQTDPKRPMVYQVLLLMLYIIIQFNNAPTDRTASQKKSGGTIQYLKR